MPYNRNSIKSYFMIVTATVMLYLWQLHLYPMINPDGVTYIQAAAAYLKGGFGAALELNDQAKWPFYSILIAGVHSLTGITILASQQLLDATLICISACLFLHLVCLFSRHRYAGFWAIIVWLTWHAYAKWWPTIVRDHGFVTCLLLSFYCYYRYTLTYKFLWALLWALCMVLAEFFRIEAVLYLALVPFSVFFLTEKSWGCRIILWLKLNIFPLMACAGVVMLFINKTLTLDSLRFDYMWHEFSFLFSAIVNRFAQAYQVMRTSIFYKENDYSSYALFFSYIVVFVCYVLTQVSLAVLPPLFLMRNSLKKLNATMFQQPFLAYSVLALLIPLFFFAEHVFLNGRYLLPLGLLVLLLTASILPHVIESLSGAKKLFFVSLVSVLFSMNFFANVFHFGHNTQDELLIGQWLKETYPNKTVFTNAKRILFYDSLSPDYKNGEVHEIMYGSSGLSWLSVHDSWCHYNLLVMSASRGQSSGQAQMFELFQKNGAIGAIVKRYKRVSNGEEILVAPIFSSKCLVMVDKMRKEKR